MTENSFDKIKKLMKVVGGKAIIVEDGKPTMVIINIDEYVDFEDTKNDNKIDNSKEFKKEELPEKIEKTEKVERVNKDINVWKNKQEERMSRQFEIENRYREKLDSESVDEDVEIENDDDEIVIEKL